VVAGLNKGKGKMSRLRILTGTALLLAALLFFGCTSQSTPPASPTSLALTTTAALATATARSGAAISGSVLGSDGAPLAQATVRIQATTNQTVTDDEGRFVLTGLEAGLPVTVSAWKDGYYCASNEQVKPPASNITFTMRLVQTNDNPDYQWIPPTGQNSCYSCKPGVTQVWLDNDAHGKSASNIRFLSMYNGTDVNGNQSPLTRYGLSRDYGRIPLLPDPSQPYFGPGYKLDFPDTTGNCSACHIPGAAIDDPYGADPNLVTGVNMFGIHCDYCHKVADVKLNPATGLPYPNMPGVLSQDIRRPFPEDKERYQIFFGSFDDDNVPMEDTYLPLIKGSAWCAPCHYGVFWNTVIYNSYGEWLSSPYGDRQTGKTCQQCHMPAPTMLEGQPITNVAPGKGGVERDPLTNPAHTFPGASSTDLLQNAVTMSVSASRIGDRITAKVTLLNDLTGHSVPTDSPLRQMILLVRATDPEGRELTLLEGLTIPEWGGVGDPEQGYYAGLPGKIFAKILMELWTEIMPTGSYWNPTRVVEDTRLGVYASDTSAYAFVAREGGKVQVEVTLLYRRAFRELIDQKGWDTPDILMERQVLTIE
jgi:mono/diheme cytochrome c family protein